MRPSHVNSPLTSYHFGALSVVVVFGWVVLSLRDCGFTTCRWRRSLPQTWPCMCSRSWTSSAQSPCKAARCDTVVRANCCPLFTPSCTHKRLYPPPTTLAVLMSSPGGSNFSTGVEDGCAIRFCMSERRLSHHQCALLKKASSSQSLTAATILLAKITSPRRSLTQPLLSAVSHLATQVWVLRRR